jgi:hypothetical protein
MDPKKQMSPPSLQTRTETDPFTETLCFPVIYNSGRWTEFRKPINSGRDISFISTGLMVLISPV